MDRSFAPLLSFLFFVGCAVSPEGSSESDGSDRGDPEPSEASSFESEAPRGVGGAWASSTGGSVGGTGSSPTNGTDSTDSVPASTGGDGPVEDVPIGPEPIGEGWEEYFPDFDYHLPPPSDEYGERYTFEDGTWNLWVLATDPSSFPGQDSGPRSEVRVRNEYSSGKRQFQGDFMVEEGAERVGIWQLFKRPYPWMIRIYDGEYRQFGDGSSFGAVPFGQWQRFYAIHDADAETLEIYIDGQLVVNESIGGTETDYYNKFGVYGREGMGAENEISWRNVHYFLQD